MISLSGIDSKELASISVVTEKYLISSNSKFLKSFHELLVKQMFGQAIFSANLEKLINPLFGKSECFYLKK
jgi:hypothetical protein